MKEKILEQMGKELKLATRVDLVIAVVGILVTLVFFGLAAGSAAATVTQMPNLSGLAGGLGGMLGGAANTKPPEFSVSSTIIMFVTLIIIFIMNWYAIRTLLKNKAQRVKLNEGMMKLYKDEAMDQYSDGSIYKTYETRYNLLAVIMGSVMALSIIVPLVVFINKLTEL
jgi:hypothetical protein